MRNVTASLFAIVTSAGCTARPQAEPPRAALVGSYVLTKTPARCRRTPDSGRLASVVQLEADGSFKIVGLPSCFAGERAPATGLAGTITGQWAIAQLEGDYVLELLVRSGSLPHGWNLGVEIRGRTAPFELYFRVGDPDERTGLVFKRASA